MRVNLLTLVLSLTLRSGTARPAIDSYRQPCFAHLRDFNILYLTSLSSRDTDATLKCDPEKPLDGGGDLLYIEAFRYAIEKVNQDPEILPNVSLGYIVLDNCQQDIGSLAAILYTMPDFDDPVVFPEDETITCETGYKRFTNVIGVIGPTWSTQAVMVGGLSTLFEIPMIFNFATSDELSDKTRFAYTMRLIPPDRFAAEAMIDLMIGFGWNYAALLYEEGAYGENGAKQIERQAKKKGVCVAFSFMFPSDFTEKEALDAAKMLAKFRGVRVVIAYIYGPHLALLLPALEDMGIADKFFWIGCDAFPRWGYRGISDGAVRVDFERNQDPGFNKHFAGLNPINTPDNPFMPYFWEITHNCVWNPSKGNNSCQRMLDKPHTYVISNRSSYGKMIDGVNVFAKGLHNFLMNKCPDAPGSRKKLRACLVGRELHAHMLNVSFDGIFSHIKFDSKGDYLGRYVFSQYHEFNDEYVGVAIWDKESQSLKINYENLIWQSKLYNDTVRGRVPEAVCSKPCGPKEYYIQKELPCCWECKTCRENEIIINNKTNCEVCPLYRWPDEETNTVCLSIEPDVLTWTSPMTIAMTAITVTGLSLCLAATAIFLKHKESKLIKASSRELMAIIMTGIVMAYVTVFFLLIRPSDIVCYLGRFGFNISVSFIFAPLMIKTNRVYRIFSAGKRGSRKPLFTGTNAQIAMVVLCILLEIALCVASAIIAPPLPMLQMRVQTVKYVEILCSLPLSGLLPPLCLNLLFILTCAVYGFLTRKLPANFNESWYIFVSVATTTFLWLVFLPAYFTAFYAVYQVMLLCCCLIINATMTLLCLYFPKIYCIYFVNECDLHLQTAGTIGTVKIAPTIATLSTVQPAGRDRSSLSTET